MSEVEMAAAGSRGRLRIRRKNTPTGVVVLIGGELDLGTAPELDRQLRDVEATGAPQLLIDLTGVEFMDSTGLHSIIRAQRSADSNGHTLTFRRGPTQVQRLFELTQTAGRLTFVD